MTSTSPASSQVTPQGTLPSQIALKGLLAVLLPVGQAVIQCN
jgi:hypothetical protein